MSAVRQRVSMRHLLEAALAAASALAAHGQVASRPPLEEIVVSGRRVSEPYPSLQLLARAIRCRPHRLDLRETDPQTAVTSMSALLLA